MTFRYVHLLDISKFFDIETDVIEDIDTITNDYHDDKFQKWS